jgi:hypothetical protein
MIKNDILQHLDYDDLPENFKIVAEVCGIDVAKQLITELEGIYINVPKITSMRTLVERYCKSHPELNQKKLARKLGLNERTISNIIRNS